MRRFSIAFALLLLLAVPAIAQVAVGTAIHPPGETLYVTAPSGLALREGPSTEDERIHFIPKGEAVVVQADNRPPVPFQVEGIQGHWVRVKHGYHEGYVFDGFLTDKQPAVEDRIDWTIVPGERVGPITWATSLEDITAQFGQENVGEALIYLGEGESVPGTAVFKNTPNEILIQWATFPSHPGAVYISQSGSKWTTNRGIAIGTSVDKLVSLNGAPVSFTGFEWDYAGAVMDWNGGSLAADHTLGDKIGLYLAAKQSGNPDVYGQFLGDSTYRSNQPGADRLGLHVNKMIVRLNRIAPKGEEKPSHPLALADMPPPQPGAKRYVLASKLNMRESPELGANVQARLPLNTVVTVVEDSGPRVPLNVNGIYGHWIKVQFHNMEGYVFDAYLVPFPVPLPGSSGLRGWAEDSLGAVSAENRQRTGDSGRGEERITQDFKHGVRIQDRRWWSPGERGHTTTAIVPGISLEQAYLLAVQCVPAFENSEFKTGMGGAITLETVNGRLLIRPEGKAVQITHSTEGNAR